MFKIKSKFSNFMFTIYKYYVIICKKPVTEWEVKAVAD